jgi:hypothetical protein
MVLVLAVAGPGFCADISNADSTPQHVTIMEAGRTSNRTIDPGENVDVCPDGCIVVFPDGSEKALSGIESIEIRNGAGHLD